MHRYTMNSKYLICTNRKIKQSTYFVIIQYSFYINASNFSSVVLISIGLCIVRIFTVINQSLYWFFFPCGMVEELTSEWVEITLGKLNGLWMVTIG